MTQKEVVLFINERARRDAEQACHVRVIVSRMMKWNDIRSATVRLSSGGLIGLVLVSIIAKEGLLYASIVESIFGLAHVVSFLQCRRLRREIRLTVTGNK